MPKLINILILTSIFLPALGLSETHPHGGVLFHQLGDVQVKSTEGEFLRAEKGEVLIEGDIVKTGPGSLAIIRFSDNSTMRITPNSNLTIESLVEPVEESILGSTNIILKAGQLFIDVINENEAPVFHIKTKSVSMGVRGTRFFAGIDQETGHTELAVKKGVVEIANPLKENHSEAIEAGHGIHVEKGVFTKPQRYDWVKKLDFNTEKKTIEIKKSQNLHANKRLEFKNKRKEWLRDENKWNLHKQKWDKSKKAHDARALKLRAAREKLKKTRIEFKSKKKEFAKKRKALNLEARNIRTENSRLRKAEQKLNRRVSLLKTGRKDPRLKLKIAREKAALQSAKKALEVRKNKYKESKLKNKKEKKKILKKFSRKKQKVSRLKSKKTRHKKSRRRLRKRKMNLKKKLDPNRPRPDGNSSNGHGGGNSN